MEKQIFKILFIYIFVVYPIFNKLSAIDFEIELKKIDKDIWYFKGLNEEASKTNFGIIANAGVIIGDKYILFVDAGPSKSFAEKLIKKVKEISDKPIKYLVITHRHFDHAFGITGFLKENPIIFFDEKEYNFFLKQGPKIREMLKKKYWI